MDNTSNALLASQTRKETIPIKQFKKKMMLKTKELFAELQRVEKLLEEKGVGNAKRFSKLRVEKLSQDEYKLENN